MEAIKFIGLLAFTWLFVKGASPVQFIKKVLNVHQDSKPRKLYLQIIQKLVNCPLCSGFWIGLAYYLWQGNESPVLMACLIAYAAHLFYLIDDNVINRFFNKL